MKTANEIEARGREGADDYGNLVNLLGVLTEACNRLDELQAAANTDFLECVDAHKGEYSALQQKVAEAEQALEVLARRNPTWFKDGRTVKTPFGSVSLKDNPPKLLVRNEEATILLIEQAGEAARARFLRQRTELNLEALSDLADEDLAPFRIRRERGDRFEAKAAKIDLGKAVKDAAKAGR